MSDWRKFLDDPDLADEPAALREIHAIRLALSEEMRGMSPQERVAWINGRSDAAIEQYGLKVVSP